MAKKKSGKERERDEDVREGMERGIDYLALCVCVSYCIRSGFVKTRWPAVPASFQLVCLCVLYLTRIISLV